VALSGSFLALRYEDRLINAGDRTSAGSARVHHPARAPLPGPQAMQRSEGGTALSFYGRS